MSIILLLLFFWDGKIILQEASIFIAIYIGYIIAVVNWKKILPYKDVDPIEMIVSEGEKSWLAINSKKFIGYIIPDCTKKPHLYLWTFLLSILAIAGLSFALVESAVGIGEILHINPTIIALTVLASGTSIPDLISSAIVAKQGRGDMAVSNAIGSNIFDILIGLGLPWLLILVIKGGEIAVATENLISSIFLLFATVLAVIFILITRKWTIGRKAGLVLIGIYIVYILFNIWQISI